MVSLYLRIWKWSNERVKKRDIFNQTVSLTYKGKESRNSGIGGGVSLLIIIIVMVYSVILFDKMIYKKEISWNQNTKRHDWANEDNTIIWDENFPEGGFIWLFDTNTNDINFYEYGTVEAKTSTEYPNGTSLEVELPNRECKNNILENTAPNSKFITAGPDYKGLEFRNSEENTTKKNFMIHFSLGSPTAGGDSNQFNLVKNHSTMIIYMDFTNKEVDLDNLEEPIRPTPNTRPEFQLRKGTYTYVNIEIRRNEVYLEDGWFNFFGDTKPVVFYSLTGLQENYFPYQGGESPGHLGIYIQANNHIFQYKRKVLTFLEVTGTIGGVFEILEIGVGIFIGFYSSYSFRKDLKIDLSHAEEKYLKLQESICKLQNSQEEILKRVQVEEEKERDMSNQLSNMKNRYNQIPVEFCKKLEANVRNNRLSKNFKFLQLMRENDDDNNNQDLRKIPDFEGGYSEPQTNTDKDVYNGFKNSLDGVNIVYSLRTLRLQVDYLLSKDLDYKRNGGTIPNSFGTQQNLSRPIHGNNRSQPRVYPEPSLHNPGLTHPETSSFPSQKPNIPRYQRVKRYLDQE